MKYPLTDDIFHARRKQLIDAVHKAVADLVAFEPTGIDGVGYQLDGKYWVSVASTPAQGFADIRNEAAIDVCCENFAKAQQPGTGTEGERGTATCMWRLDGQWKVGSYLPTVTFCPWCGKAK